VGVAFGIVLISVAVSAFAAEARPQYKSPSDVAVSPDGKFAYVTNQTANSLSVIDVPARKAIKEIAVGKLPWGVTVSGDGKTVFVANTLSHSISVVDPVQGKAVAEIKCGFEPIGLCLSPDGKTLYSANYISDDVSVIDVTQRKEVARIKVSRAPSYLAITPDGKRLLVNNFLPATPATDPKTTMFISVIDTAGRKVVGQIRSPGTMAMARGMTISPDGKFAFTVHHRPNFNVTPSQLSQGWVHTAALTVALLDDPNGKVYTFLLDNVNSGAANPYGVALSPDGNTVYVTHRGIHRMSVIDLTKLKQRVAATKPEVLKHVHFNLGFLWGKSPVIRRVDSGGLGPRGVAVSPVDGSIFVANYFSDSLAVLDPKSAKVVARIPVGPKQEMTQVRRGELLFHDARHCFQEWVSCTSCHPRIRADGVNWDLLNDGMTNPKNAKSLVGSHETPPSMSLGVRAKMEVAVEKGFLFIQFHQASRDEIDAVSAFLRSVPYIASPWHRKPDGSLDDLATLGKQVFEKAACGDCHPAPLFTDLEMYDVGTRGKRDFPEHTEFDVPTLKELYRTGPFLHDGRAATLRDVLTTHNKDDEHGDTSKLTEEEIDALIAYLMTL